MKYDVVIVGTGPAGIACARECKLRSPSANVLLLEQGQPINKRVCPNQRTGKGCINCTTCAVMSGWGGAGAHSDGKFTMPQNPGPYHIGGNLPDYIGLDQTNQLVLEQHYINMKHGAPDNIVKERDNAYVKELDTQLSEIGLFRADAHVNHIGTSGVRNLYSNYYTELQKLGVEIRFRTIVDDLIVKNGKMVGVKLDNGERIRANYVVLATGRSGSKWLEKMSTKYGIALEPENVDLGLRIEVPDSVMEQLNRNLYEAKILAKYEDGVMVRMFCTNPHGGVVCETADGIKFVNGHADNKALSDNTNFAVLATYKTRMAKPSEWVRSVGRAINDIGRGQPVVQRWGDLIRGKSTDKWALDHNKVIPSLKSATPGDISGVMPEKALTAIKRYMKDLGKVIPGLDDPDTLAYGLEAKFCHAGISLNNKLQCNLGAYILGDAGCTHGLASATASGIYVARQIYPD